MFSFLRRLGSRKPREVSEQDVGSLMEQVEHQVRAEMKQKAVKVGFFGGIQVDPKHVYVSKEQAEHSMRSLERLRAQRAARAEEKDPERLKNGYARPSC